MAGLARTAASTAFAASFFTRLRAVAYSASAASGCRIGKPDPKKRPWDRITSRISRASACSAALPASASASITCAIRASISNE